MSNSFAIAAVTATLRSMLGDVKIPLPIDPPGDSELADAHCTVRPPDKARSAEDQNQVNLFLYQTAANAAMRNLDMPGQTLAGETAFPPLAVNLYYLLTAYGKNFDDILSHRLLGRAMSILHDRAILLPNDIMTALPNNDAWRQIERVRITPHAMSTEEISKLWAVFQTPYRVSAAYEASVVLIDSSRPARTPLPVLTRGAIVQPNVTPPYPTITELDFVPPAQPTARLGDQVLIVGHNLASQVTGATTTVTLANDDLTGGSVDATSWVSQLTPLGFTLTIPNSPSLLVAGLCTLTVTVTEPVSGGSPKVRTSNAVPLAIAPTITSYSTTSTSASATGTYSVDVQPDVRIQQRATLLVGDTEFLSYPHLSGPTNLLQFDVSGLAPGFYPLRVRIDGIDSFIVDYAKSPPVMATAFPRSVTLT